MTRRKPKNIALSLVFAFINEMASEAEGNLSRWAEAWGRLLRKSKTDPPFIKALGRITPVLGLNATEQVLICLVDSWVCWGPSKTENQRDAYRTARKLNDEISKDAAALADKLAQRWKLVEKNGVGGYRGNSLLDCMETWERTYENLPYPYSHRSDPSLFSAYIWPELQRLNARIESKSWYWPDMYGLLITLSDLAKIELEDDLLIHDEITADVLESPQKSTRDFLRALFRRLENETYGGGGCGLLREGIATDKSIIGHTDMASLSNAVLGDTEASISSDDVRQLRNELKKPENSP